MRLVYLYVARGRIVKQNRTVNQSVSSPREVPQRLWIRLGNPCEVLTNIDDFNDFKFSQRLICCYIAIY